MQFDFKSGPRCWSAGWDGREFWTNLPPYVDIQATTQRTAVIQGVLQCGGAPLSAKKVLAIPGLDLRPERVTGNGTIVLIDRTERRLWAYRTRDSRGLLLSRAGAS